jgi:hypothetical protein
VKLTYSRGVDDYMGVIVTINVAAGVLLAVSIFANPANPYASIAERNIFGLREPSPIKPEPPPPVAADTSELTLTGIVDFQKAKWALLTCAERGKQLRRYTLSIGEKQDNIQVLNIDAEAATVRVLHGSAEVVLTFEKPNAGNIEELGRKYVQQSKPFVDEHTRAHAVREQREAERRELERAAAEAELATRQISTHMDEPRF